MKADATPPRRGGGPSPRRPELQRRVLSALVLAAAALGTAWVGGLLLGLFWAAAAAVVAFEWMRMIGPGRPAWLVLGVVCSFGLLAAPVLIRGDPFWGFAALVWVFAVVWGSDVMAFCCGRLIGGPKLMPRVSPNKTWAGFIGGTSGAVGLGVAVAALAGAPRLAPVALLALGAAVATQAGDLLESALKRHFGVKDTGSLIPGHGGVMDRVDGFLPAAVLIALVGLARGGVGGVGQGILLW